MAWVKFHDALCKGAKRGLSRSTRFVYMEIALAARELGGEVELPVAGDIVDAVHDRIGGSRKEIAAALPDLTGASDGDDPMLTVTATTGRRVIVVTTWCQWNKIDDSNGRVTRYRAKMKRESNAPVTSLEERREEERRGDGPAAPSPATKRARNRTPCPESTHALAKATFVADWSLGAPDNDELTKFLDYHRSKGSMMADWAAAWRTWMRNAQKFAAERGSAPPGETDDYETRSRRELAARNLAAKQAAKGAA